MNLGKRCPDWTADEDSVLRAAWAAGHTASSIARALPRRTRDAVCGRALRLGLPRRPSPIPAIAQRERAAAIRMAVDDEVKRRLVRP